MIKVAITHNPENIGQAINQALDSLNIEDLILNKVVAIKPNETWASKNDTTAVTQPDTLLAVIRFIKKFHPKQLIVSGGSGAGETEEIMRIAGLMQVIKDEGIEFFDHNRPPFKTIPLEYASHSGVDGPQKEVIVNPHIFNYETVISLAQLKVHQTATVTLCMKNLAMSYPAADYYGHPRASMKNLHHFFEDMHSFIAAMIKRFPAQLGIIVGHPAMVGIGPIGGHTVETGLVIASQDILAADTVGAKLLGFDTEGVGQLKKAGLLGIGENDLKKMEFLGLGLKEAIRIFTQAAYGKEVDQKQIKL